MHTRIPLINTRHHVVWGSAETEQIKGDSLAVVSTSVWRWGVQLVWAGHCCCAESKQGHETPQAQWNLSQGQRGITALLSFSLSLLPFLSFARSPSLNLTHTHTQNFSNQPKGTHTHTRWLCSTCSADKFWQLLCKHFCRYSFHEALTLSLNDCN